MHSPTFTSSFIKITKSPFLLSSFFAFMFFAFYFCFFILVIYLSLSYFQKTLLSSRIFGFYVAFQAYRKGSRAEHELMQKLSLAGFLVIRAAGSGSGSPCPDILAFRRTEQLGFECKAIDGSSLQLDRKQVENLRQWEEKSSITTYIAWRRKGGEWHFIRLYFLNENEKSYSISSEQAKKVGLGLEQILGEGAKNY
jgi:Holliday junction resolvase